MQMRPSRVLEKLRAGKAVNLFKLNLDSVRAAELAAMHGYDCLWLDVEHTASDWSLIQNQIYAAKSQNCDSMVRVRRGSYNEISVPLELDASGVMVPHIMSLEDAQQVVYQTRFGPIGRRAVDGGNADGSYCNVGFADYVQQANENRFLAVQIEDPEVLDDLEAIAALPGIDIIFFGPGDFSHAVGAPGDMNHPLVVETRKRVAEVAIKHGKFAGTPANPDNLDELLEMGYRFLPYGADVLALNPYCIENVANFQKRNGQASQEKSSTGYYGNKAS